MLHILLFPYHKHCTVIIQKQQQQQELNVAAIIVRLPPIVHTHTHIDTLILMPISSLQYGNMAIWQHGIWLPVCQVAFIGEPWHGMGNLYLVWHGNQSSINYIRSKLKCALKCS